MPFLKDLQKTMRSRTGEMTTKTDKNGVHAMFYKKSRRTGDWLNNEKSGLGWLYWSQGKQLYEGDWANNYLEGYGTTATRQPLTGIYKLKYKGQWRHNKKNGVGLLIYPNGDIYEGEWLDDKRHGLGRLYLADGGYYIGGFANDMKNGYGVLYFGSTGNRFEGIFVDDYKHGPGKFIMMQTGQVFSGVWVNDVFTCGTVEDYCLRQRATQPTPYAIPPIKLIDADRIDQQQRKRVLEGEPEDCLNIEDLLIDETQIVTQ